MQASSNIDSKSVNSTLTRRAALAGVALLAAPSTALAAPVPGPDDPVGALIQRHVRAWIAWSSMVSEIDGLEARIPSDQRKSETEEEVENGTYKGDHPDWIDHLIRLHKTNDEMDAAATEMTRIELQSLWQIVLLLNYVDGFNQQMLTFGRHNWSSHHLWPDDLVDDDVRDKCGNHVEMPWAFWVMRNIRAALEDLAMQKAA